MMTCLLLTLIGCAPAVTDGDGDGYPSDQDCDDSNNTIHPGATEACDGLDQNCDGEIDEGVTATWYADQDVDGHGSDADTVTACSPPEGYRQTGGDCDDSNDAVFPGAPEQCNEVDDDCDGAVDNGVESTFYYDGDEDGFGNSSVSVTGCEEPLGYVSLADDCDDGDDTIYPGATEECDGQDQDCDGVADNGVTTRWYLDGDFDGYGDPGTYVDSCDPPEGYVADGTDCDDSSAAIHPDNVDLCNGDDDDCDGDIDEDSKSGWNLVSIDHSAEVIWKVDPTTATLTKLVDLEVVDHQIPTMDVREDGLAVVHDSYNLELDEIDVCNGVLTTIGETGAGKTCGISFGPGGVLYGLDNTNDTLIQFNPTTGAATSIGSLGFDIGACGLSYDCQNDVLIGADAKTDQIFEVDIATGAATAFKSTGANFASVGIEFDAASGMLLASTGSALFEIDPTSGATTSIGSFGSSSASSLVALINDLAYYPECP